MNLKKGMSRNKLNESIRNTCDDLELIAKDILNMISNFHSEKSDAKFFRRLDTKLHKLDDLLPGPITPQKLSGLDYQNPESVLKLERFASKFYSHLLECIINIVDDANWFGCSSSNIPGSLIRLFVVDGANLTMFYELLDSVCAIVKSEHENSSKIDVSLKLLEFFVKCDAIQSAYFDLPCEVNDTGNRVLRVDQNKVDDTIIEMVNRKEIWCSAVQLFVSLPNQVANKLKGKVPDLFLRNTFCSLCCYHIAKCVDYSAGIKIFNKDKILYIDCLAKFFSKVLLSFNGCDPLRDLIKVFYFWCVNDSESNIACSYRDVIQKLFSSLDVISIPKAAILVLENCCDSGLADVKLLLGIDIINISGWYHVLLKKIPFLSFTSDDVIKNLVFCLGNIQLIHFTINIDEQRTLYSPCKENVLSNLFLELITVWSDRTSITHNPIEQHLYLSKIIILSVKFISSHFVGDNNLKMYMENVKLKLFNGLPIHLESTSEMVRVIGMITSECVIKILNSVNYSDSNINNAPVPLEFDFSNLKEECLAVVNNFRQLSDCDFSQELFASPVLFKDLKLLDNYFCRLMNFTNVELSLYDNNTDEGREGIVNDYSENNLMNTDDKMAIESSYSNEDNGLDSDDDLVPYDLSNDDKVMNRKRPNYLRDLIKNLVEANEQTDPEVWIASLEICEQLVLNQLPNDDTSLGLELMDILISLDSKYACENLDDLKFSAALAIILVYPADTAEYICKKFHEENKFSISQRSFILDLLSGGAKILSDPSKDPFKKTTDRKELFPVFGTSSGSTSQNSNWQEIVKERIRSKTRYFHSKQISSSIEKKNVFAKVAGSFFFPLLRGQSSKGRGIMFRVDAHSVESPEESLSLLVHILRTCAVIMACSLNCHAATKMGKELLEATWSLRFHPEAKIREEVISCIAAVILAVPQSILKCDLLNDVIEARMWLDQIYSSQGILKGMCEVDENCRNFAKQVIYLINSIVPDDLSVYE